MSDSKQVLPIASILPPDAVKALVEAYYVATNLPEGSAARARCVQRAIDMIVIKYPELFKKD